MSSAIRGKEKVLRLETEEGERVKIDLNGNLCSFEFVPVMLGMSMHLNFQV